MSAKESAVSAPAGAPALSRLLLSTAQAVRGVREGRSLSDLLPQVPAALRPGTQALAFTVMRRLGVAQALRARLAPRPPAPPVEALVLCALALLWPQDGPPPYADHTLVDQAVAATRRLSPGAAGFVNAVLRRFLREREALVAAVRQDPVARANHPRWWIQRLQADWPDQAEALMAAAAHHPPMALRVNSRQQDRDRYRQALEAAGLAADLPQDPQLPDALVLHQPCPVERLPGFAEGTVSVQDLSAQRSAALLLGPQGQALPPGARVLDACAAPGGKTAHLLERADLEVLALDADPSRLTRVDQTLSRLGLRARTQAADARAVAHWWDGQLFDAILLDAPCSASGIVRRHPDIAWLRREADITALAQVQAELLDALWPLLKPGGRLLYATCSVFKAEGQDQIAAFLQRLGTDQVQVDPVSPGHLLPLADNAAGRPAALAGDGFFYALLHKPSPA
ncbi:16S rRNA (cytosine(967)-C(5))-methyltransferase RsmB [Ideonella livida]|uniref:16S rRNA (cytosine(967)-C(5))-methyltransferase n=1 Tax=Ideonella livida TaxID=2707176 RepID=A0A7C9PGN6_9BURK|nr:16S rRNA (cytosine(967)-C(5))-methyltransferase RsmB [Ideonella livida]NDY90952.1 16S rRNA (cytosine(967)-C(5))-methyltransferase RsmB [Ideonella livida]